MSNTVASRLAPLSVFDAGGHTVPLGSAWAGRQAVLAFVRHFG